MPAPPPAASSGPHRPGRRRLVAWLPWGALIVVAAVALGVGLHRSGPPPTLAERTLSVASQVRCPVCVGETAAQSQTAASIAIRSFIHQQLAAGRSPDQILAQIERDYGGPSILEDPTRHGSGLLLWFGPVVAVVVAVGALALAFRHWRPTARRAASDSDRRLVGGAMDPDRRLVGGAMDPDRAPGDPRG